jgi:hypothetical protein
MELEITILSKIRPVQKNKYCMFPTFKQKDMKVEGRIFGK